MKPLSAPAAALGTLGLLAAVALVYANSLAGPFQFDDYNVIVDNRWVHGLEAWWQSMPGFRPLLKLSHALNWAASPSPWGFHALNLAVHGANALLVWALARHWLAALARPTLAADAAWWLALLFALHPAATEAVTYISGRSVSLVALPYLASLLCFAEGQRRGNRWLSALASPLLFALALGVRETAVTLPVALFLLAWFAGASPRAALRGLGPHLAVLLLALLAALATGVYARFLHYSLGTRGVFEQLLAQAEALRYLSAQAALFLPPNVDPDLRVPVGPDARTLATLAAVVFAAAIALLSRRRWPWLGFGFAWVALQLAPTNSLLPRFDLANDRHLYLALPGLALLLVVPLLQAGWRPLGRAALLALALWMGLLAHRRNDDWRSELALWQATVQSSPDKARPWVNLGWARQQAGDTEGARAAYECALALDPAHEQALVNRALLPGAGPSRAPDPACPAR